MVAVAGRDGSGPDGAPSDVPDARREVGAVWRKSAASNPSGNCVELAGLVDGSVAVRNSRFPDGPRLVYTRAEVAAFFEGVRTGEFDDLLD